MESAKEMNGHAGKAPLWKTAAVIAAVVILAACTPQVRTTATSEGLPASKPDSAATGQGIHEKTEDLPGRSSGDPTPLTMEQAMTQTLEISPTATATKVPTEVVAPTPTIDAVTAAKVEAMRSAVGDKIEDWVSFNDFLQKHLLSVVYIGEDLEVKGKELINGKGEVVGKVFNAFKGELLIGNDIKEVTFVYYYQESGTGVCRLMGWGYEIDCAALTEDRLQPSKTIERKGQNYWNAVPGQVVSMYVDLPYIELPGASADPFDNFNNRYLDGKEDLIFALLEEGDTSIGVIVPRWNTEICDANNQVTVPFFCYEDPIIITDYGDK